ncbi:hypothetical protein [Streptomyces sp. NPDC085665]|uniref:hypothetical protein n=1 Tax=Streptomyces sp. NPDC085665 TaxID=3365735 RepID=UPI0037D4DE21
MRSGPHIQDRADEFFDPLAGRLNAAMSPYPPQLLERFEQFMTDLNATMDAHLAERRPATPHPPGAPGDRRRQGVSWVGWVGARCGGGDRFAGLDAHGSRLMAFGRVLPPFRLPV